MILIENKPLAPFTTFAIGGPARWFVEAETEDDIVEANAWAQEHAVPLFVLGGGSNLLIADEGFDGLVLRIALRGIQNSNATGQINSVPHPFLVLGGKGGKAVTSHPHQTIYQVAAGEDWDRFVQRTVEDNCAGVECLAGIPGTVGGTPVQNVGAYGQEVSTSIECVRAFDRQHRAFVEFTADECAFAYRHSRFNSVDRGRYIVTSVAYRLTPGGAPTVRYGDLHRALEAKRSEDAVPGRELTLADVAAVVRKVRQTKGMLMVQGDPDCRSAGSFFKNAVVTEEQVRLIAKVSEVEPPHFPAGSEPEHAGLFKVPAAWLIEQAGFSKGYARGAAAISSRHTLALINRGSQDGAAVATAVEILALAAEIVTLVEARFSLHLEMEPVMLGFTRPDQLIDSAL